MVAGSNPARGASHGFYIRHDRLNLDQRGIMRQLEPRPHLFYADDLS